MKLKFRDLLGVKPKSEMFFLKPVNVNPIMLICPTCAIQSDWLAPPGFQIAIVGHLLATCPNGHRWVIAGAFEKAPDHSWMKGVYGLPEGAGD